MSELVGLSFDAAASPEISFERPLTSPLASSGWGMAWFPAGELAAAVLRDPFSGASLGLSHVLHDFDRFRTTLIVAHLRGAEDRAPHRDTHPFVRQWGGRSWVMAHDGDLRPGFVSQLPLPEGPQFAPTGATDTEHMFSWLLAEAQRRGAWALAELGYEDLHRQLADLNQLGGLSVLLADGDDLVAYRDAAEPRTLWWTRRVPPHPETLLASAGVSVAIDTQEDANRTMVLVSSLPLSEEGWIEFEPGQMLAVRRGSVVFNSVPALGGETGPQPPVVDSTDAGVRLVASPPARPSANTLERPHRRTLEVVHETSYRYDESVERSSHRFRLTPVEDDLQRVREHEVLLNRDGTRFHFEDVFGNKVVGFEIGAPFQELVVTARSVVDVIEPMDRPELLPERHTLPLVWMPWQHQMMTPYLLPPELPENELRELAEYAMSFADRNRRDLLSALDDMTASIQHDFTYQPGTTTLSTTPYEVFEARTGVCQDFANLMITLCRLLAVPARYRVGYVHTGADYDNTVQSEASHAWVEVYLPYLGWRGYDPTNGRRAGSDHVRVAAGRNYRDATPTAGVIRRGGRGEQLALSVRVRDVSEAYVA